MDIVSTLRQYRIGPYSIFDFATAYLGIFIVSPLLTRLAARFNLNISRTNWLWLTIPIGIITHIIIRQHTLLTSQFLNPNGDYLVKIIVLFMVYMGLKDIKKPLEKPGIKPD